ncbi:MAG: hypothetical protein AAFN77_21035 [Planctomycetota bacterium]
MGVWGSGLLDNDTSWNYIGDFTSEVRQQIIEIGDESSRKHAGLLAGSIGILLRLGASCFDPIPGLERPHFYPQLILALSNNFEHWINFPGRTPEVLMSILYGWGEQLSERPPILKKSLHSCFHEKTEGASFSLLESDLFANPSSLAFLKKKIKGVVAAISKEVVNPESVEEMGYSNLNGMLALLHVLPTPNLNKRKVERWAKIWRESWRVLAKANIEMQGQFAKDYQKRVSKCFALLVKKCAAASV